MTFTDDQKRQILLVSVMLGMLAIAAMWSLSRASEQASNAQYAMDDLTECQRLADSIAAFRSKPTIASAKVKEDYEMGARIDDASKKANLPPDSLQGLFPQSARRRGRSSYLEKPTSLALRDVSLPQLATFLHHLSDNTGLTVRDVRIRTPHGSESGNRWDAEATVTYLIYQPTTKRK